ncbi:MAG TPA: hypothetical protein VFR90_12550 [Methylibium sp.]|uniref:hypothetical protein n=1 Tax=Methylibium sp. TaxID=2067992 RepID=UPI002DB57510|nr:hypothetical protein [Methylibium sp.]HEU4459944.1 hypothetical protein [Methylibium sp.]
MLRMKSVLRFRRSATAAARLGIVRRWLSILLLVLLPFQSAWAQAAHYDSHEGGSHAMHFGHHDHGHSDTPDASDSDADTGAQKVKSDGHHCHGQCSAMPASVCLVPTVIHCSTFDDRSAVYGGAHAPPRPERPQWRPLA